MKKENELNRGDRLYKIFIYLVLGLLALLILAVLFELGGLLFLQLSGFILHIVYHLVCCQVSNIADCRKYDSCTDQSVFK